MVANSLFITGTHVDQETGKKERKRQQRKKRMGIQVVLTAAQTLSRKGKKSRQLETRKSLYTKGCLQRPRTISPQRRGGIQVGKKTY